MTVPQNGVAPRDDRAVRPEAKVSVPTPVGVVSACGGARRQHRRHRRNAQVPVLKVPRVACEMAEPRSASYTVKLTGSARVTALDRSESWMTGIRQGVAKAITGFLGNV